MKPGSWSVVSSLGSALQMGGSALEDVPGLLAKVLDEELWREFKTPRGEARHDSFESFVTTPPTQGLGTSVALIRRIVSDDPKARDLLDQALQRPAGGDTRSHNATNGNNVPNGRPEGNEAAKALRRLRKDRPDLHQDVIDGRISPHGAMVAAGFRPRTATVRLDDPKRAADTLRKKLTVQQRKQLAAYLLEDV